MVKSGEPFANFQSSPESLTPLHANVHLLLDNLRSTLNVGSIFRTANGVGVQEIYCCGTTPTPQHPKVKKSSLGAEITTEWSYAPNGLKLANELKQAGHIVIALEKTANSSALFDIQQVAKPNLTLVLGNEISGIDPQILDIADTVVHIPMYGSKSSINVAVAAGIALYFMVNMLSSPQRSSK
jgi:tRNA G18 (ribose-2'-O)-methylase SpoU